MKTSFIKNVALAGTFALVCSVSFFSTSIYGQNRSLSMDPGTGSGGFQRVETNCVCRSTGTVVGTANNCGPGMGMCIDTDCSGMSC